MLSASFVIDNLALKIQGNDGKEHTGEERRHIRENTNLVAFPVALC